MKTTDFGIQITSSNIKENLKKQFNVNVDLEHYSREQLEDIRNKLRTRIFQQEGSIKVNDLLTNENYQKDKAMMQLLNTRIKEMLGEQMKKLRDQMDALTEGKKKGDGNLANNAKPYDKVTRGDVIAGRLGKDEKGGKKTSIADKKATPKKGVNPFAKKDTKVKETKSKMCPGCKKPINLCGCKDTKDPTKGRVHKMKEGAKHARDCDCKECMEMYEGNFGKLEKKLSHQKGVTNPAGLAAKIGRDKYGKAGMEKKAAAGRKKANESFKHNVRFVNESIEWLLNEDEEGKAKAITAAGDMVNDFTNWMQRVGQYQTKSMIELADAIRADFGTAEAEAFKQAVGPALSTTLEVLTQQREVVSNAVATLATGSAPAEPMGAEPNAGMDMEAGLDSAEPDDMNPEPGADLGDEFGAADAAAGGAETSGRGLRESRQRARARKLAEAHSIMSKLAK